MSGVILTLLEQPEVSSALLTASECLADLLGGASVDVLVVRILPESTIIPSEEILTNRHAAEIRASEQLRAAALRKDYDRWVARSTVNTNWCDVEGLVDAVVKERGARADIIVLRQPSGVNRFQAGQEIQTALFETDRPILVVPPNVSGPFGRKVAIAWRNDQPATRAVLSSLRRRVKPERVFVLAGTRPGVSAPKMPDILSEHDIEAELHVLPLGSEVFGKVLLAKAHELGADLLVMGAYQHSPMREWILGGVTRFMLQHADIPILMRH